MKTFTTDLTNIPYLKEELDHYVIGHDNEKLQLISLILNHFNKYDLYKMGKITHFRRSNALIVGESGIGKTFLVETICKLLDIPFICIDSTNITAKGWKGDNVEDYLGMHYETCHCNESRFRRSIVFFDEFDKVRNFYGGEIDYGRKDQASFLKIMESDEAVVPYGDDKKTLRTDGILFIFAGAFSDIQLSKRNCSEIGFISSNLEDKKTFLNERITTDVLINHGVMVELAGRISQIIELKPLSKDEMKQILLESNGSALKEWNEYLEQFNTHVTFDDHAIDYLINQSMKNKTGARELNNQINQLFNKQFQIIVNSQFNSEFKVTLDENNELKFIFTKKLEEEYMPIISSKKYSSHNLKLLQQSLGFNEDSNNNMKKMNMIISGIINRMSYIEKVYLKDEKRATHDILYCYLMYILNYILKEDQVYMSLLKLIDITHVNEDKFGFELLLLKEKPCNSEKNEEQRTYDKIMKRYNYFKMYCSKYPFNLFVLKKAIIDYLHIEDIKQSRKER